MVGWAVNVSAAGGLRHVDRLFIGDDIHKVEEAALRYLRAQKAAHAGQSIEYGLDLVTDIVPIK